MQAVNYEGYFNNGRFYSFGKEIHIPENRRVIIAIFDEIHKDAPDKPATRKEAMDLDRLINSIGMSTFVKYYYNFKNCSRDYCISNFEEPFTDKAKSSKTGHAQSIFNRNLEKDALIKIAKSQRVDANARFTAEEILKTEFSYMV